MLAVLLWVALAVSVVLAVIGVVRRSATALLVAGTLSLVFCGAAMLSVGRFVLLIPLLVIAIGAGYLAEARRTTLYVLGGVAAVLYVAQMATLL